MAIQHYKPHQMFLVHQLYQAVIQLHEHSMHLVGACAFCFQQRQTHSRHTVKTNLFTIHDLSSICACGSIHQNLIFDVIYAVNVILHCFVVIMRRVPSADSDAESESTNHLKSPRTESSRVLSSSYSCCIASRSA